MHPANQDPITRCEECLKPGSSQDLVRSSGRLWDAKSVPLGQGRMAFWGRCVLFEVENWRQPSQWARVCPRPWDWPSSHPHVVGLLPWDWSWKLPDQRGVTALSCSQGNSPYEGGLPEASYSSLLCTFQIPTLVVLINRWPMGVHDV